jgi:hypothetical protein
MPELLLNVVTTWIEELVMGNKFFMPVSNKFASCELPSINSFFVKTLWSQPVFRVGKLVAVLRSEIRALRRVVKQLPVEKHQQCSSARMQLSCRHCMSRWFKVHLKMMKNQMRGLACTCVFQPTQVELVLACNELLVMAQQLRAAFKSDWWFGFAEKLGIEWTFSGPVMKILTVGVSIENITVTTSIRTSIQHSFLKTIFIRKGYCWGSGWIWMNNQILKHEILHSSWIGKINSEIMIAAQTGKQIWLILFRGLC